MNIVRNYTGLIKVMSVGSFLKSMTSVSLGS